MTKKEEKMVVGERAKVVKHQDNIKVEGKFEGRSKSSTVGSFARGERMAIVRHKDNLKMEGKFNEGALHDQKQVVGERSKVVKHQDNLKSEGAFHGERKTMAVKGERAEVKKHADNLFMEGKFEKREQQTVLTGERAEIKRHQDNLKVEGKFEGRQKVNGVLKGERASITKHQDNLKMEGEFIGRQETAVAIGERAKVVKHRDNLKLEGSFKELKSESQSSHVFTKGDRMARTKHEDNLKMSGSIQFESTANQASKAITKVQYSGKRGLRKDVQSSIVVGSDTNSTTEAADMKLKERNRQVTNTGKVVTETRSASAASKSKQVSSQEVNATVTQNESQEAHISAVKNDKFASSLREASGVQVGQQRDVAIIEQHHRRQSSSANASLQSSARYQQQQQHHSQSGGRYESFGGGVGNVVATDYMYGSNGSASHSNYQRWSNSAQMENRRESQHTVKNAWVASATAQQQQQYQQQFQQQRAALQHQQMQQQSSSHEVRTSSAGRRRTWAESSVLHGDMAFAGGSAGRGNTTSYLAEYHEHHCPASNIGQAKSPYKYERQTGSGHKVYLPSVSN